MAIGIVIGNDKLLEVIVVLSCSVSSTISYGLIGIYYLLNWIISFNYNFLYTLLIFFTFEEIFTCTYVFCVLLDRLCNVLYPEYFDYFD